MRKSILFLLVATANFAFAQMFSADAYYTCPNGMSTMRCDWEHRDILEARRKAYCASAGSACFGYPLVEVASIEATHLRFYWIITITLTGPAPREGADVILTLAPKDFTKKKPSYVNIQEGKLQASFRIYRWPHVRPSPSGNYTGVLYANYGVTKSVSLSSER